VKDDILIQKYTRALFEVAEENKVLDEVEKGLLRISDTFKNLPELGEYLMLPQVDWKLKLELSENLTKGLSEYIVNFVKLVMEKERQFILPHVYEHFHVMMDLKRKRSKAVITTVVKIGDPVKKQLQDKLKELFSDDFILETKEDPSIIGGVKVQMGFTVIDGTLKRKLEQLGRLLAKG